MSLRRSLSLLLGGFAVFVALGGCAMLFELPRALAGGVTLAMLAALVAALWGVVGYFCWFFRSEVENSRR